jgi:hypothetical protein
LPSTNSICSSVRRSSFTSGTSLSTCMPSLAGVVQDAAVRPSMRTEQTLHEPCGLKSG